MKKSPIIFITTLAILLLISSGFALADDHGKGNEKKNENGAQVTFEGDTKTVENKNFIKINIKASENINNGKEDEDNDDHKNENGKDVDDDDDDAVVSPTPTTSVTPTITPTETPTVTPSVTPTETPTITPTETPTVTPTGTQQQVFINAKIKGTFAVDQIVTFFENLIDSIKSAFQTT